MRLAFRTRVLTLFLLAVVSLTATPIKRRVVGPLDPKVVAFVKGTYVEGTPYTDAVRLSPGAYPTLKRMLDEQGYSQHWSKIVAYIGVIGVPESYETLRAFVWDRFRGPVNDATFRALLVAQRSIGYIPLARDKRILEYLVSSTNPDAWAGLPWSGGNMSAAALRVTLSKQSITSLSYTGTDRAEQVLTWLADHPYAAELRASIIDAMPRNRAIRASGLLRYMQKQERGHRY